MSCNLVRAEGASRRLYAGDPETTEIPSEPPAIVREHPIINTSCECIECDSNQTIARPVNRQFLKAQGFSA